MATEMDAEEPSQGSRWIRKLGMILGLGLALLVIIYFVATSTAFLKAVILPRAGQSLHADITVQDASISPFSHVTLRKLRVKTTGAEPLITVDEVQARYDLLAILRGNIKVREVTLLSPDVRIVQETDGKSNLDPFLGKEEKTPRPNSKQSSRLEIQNINLKNGHVLLLKKDKSGSTQTTELSNLDLSLDRLQNGQSGKASLGTVLKLAHNPSANAQGTNDLLEAKVVGSFDFAIDPQLLPKDIKGTTHFDVTRAEGAYADLGGLGAVLVADITPAEMRQVALRFERGGQRLGQLLVSGPFDVGKAEARLKIEVQSLDRQVLNLFGAAHGWDFGTSTLNAMSVVDLSRDWKLIIVTGHLNGQQLSLTQNKQSTPALDLDVEFQTQVNLEEQTATVQKLNVLGKRNAKEILTASLDKPMNITWAERARGFTESNFRLALKQLDLNEWAAMFGTNVPAGQVDLQLNVLAQKDAKQLTTKLSTAIQDFTSQFGSNRIEHALVKFDAENFLEDFRMGDLRSFSFGVRARRETAGQRDWFRQLRSLREAGHRTAHLRGGAARAPETGVSSWRGRLSGALRVSTAFTHTKDKDVATGVVALNDFTGTGGEYHLQHFEGVLDYNLDLSGNVLQLYRANFSIRQGFESGGSVDVAGKINLTNKAAQFTFKAVELNQNALRPFLAPSWATKNWFPSV